MADQYCEVDFGDYSDDADPVSLYDEKLIKARKAAACNECGGEIAVGEFYLRKSYRFEGEFCRERVCSGCREVAGEFDHRLVGQMLWSTFEEEWSNGANLQGCLNRLTSVKAKTVMREQWLKWQAKREEYERRRRERLAELKKPTPPADVS